MTRKKTIAKHVQQALSKSSAAPIIGALVYWTLREIDIDEGALRALYAKHDVDLLHFPPTISAASALRKACKVVNGRYAGTLVRPAGEDDDEIVIGFVDETQDKKRKVLDYDPTAYLRFNKKTSKVTIDGAHDAADEAATLYEHLSTHYISMDIRRQVLRSLKSLGAMALNRAGGTYLVPPGAIDTVDKLGRIVEDLNGATEFFTLCMYGDPVTKGSLARGAKRSLEEDLADLQSEIAKFTDRSNVRPTTIQHRVDDVRTLKERATLFADILSMKAEELTDGIKVAEASLLKLLGAADERMVNRYGEKRADQMRQGRADAGERRVQRIAKKRKDRFDDETETPKKKVVVRRKKVRRVRKVARNG